MSKKTINIEAELDLISIIARDPNIIFKHDLILTEDLFTDPTALKAFRFIGQQHSQGDTIIVPSLFSKEEGEQKLFKNILDREAPDGAYTSIVETLSDLFVLRKLRVLSRNLSYDVDKEQCGSTIVNKYGELLSNLQFGAKTDSIPDIKKDMASFMDKLGETYSTYISGGTPKITGPVTGTGLDQCIIGGFQPGDLTVIAARPSTGKSELALQIAIENMARGTPVAFFSLEMSKPQVITRMMAAHTGISATKIKRVDGLTSRDMEILQGASEEMSNWNFYIDSAESVSVTDILTKSKKLKFIEPNLGLIIVDHLQLVRNNLVSGTRNEEVGHITRALKLLSGEIQVPVILLSQLRRIDELTDYEPGLNDLRDSGEIEANIDIGIFLHAPKSERKNPKTKTKIYIEKNRNNPLGYIFAENHKHIQRFKEIETHVD